jgi:hypothetical protein
MDAPRGDFDHRSIAMLRNEAEASTAAVNSVEGGVNARRA